MEKSEIIMYTMPTCGYCAKMKQELEAANVEYTERNFKEFKKEWEYVKSLTRSAVFPTFVIGKEYLIPNRDFSNPQEAIQSLLYYQTVTHREPTMEDIVELLKNNMYITKMALDRIDVISKKLQEEEDKKNHLEELERRRKEVVNRNKKLAEEIQNKRNQTKDLYNSTEKPTNV